MSWTNQEVRTGIRQVVSQERQGLVLFLRYLIEVEKREIFLEDGASTIYDYCERLLGFSHGTALKRVWVARSAARFPLILDLLGSGKLHLTAVSYLVKHLTEQNHVELLTTAIGKKETELKWWLSGLYPEKLPPDWELNGREKIIPLDGERAKLILVVDKAFVEQLSRSKQVHKHKYPDGNALSILKRALTEDLYRHDPIEKAKRARKPKGSDKAGSQLIPRGISQNLARAAQMIPHGISHRPAQVKITTRQTSRRVEYAIRQRDQHRCIYVSPQGVRCAEKAGLEKDHGRAWAKGGSSDDPGNIGLLCFAHNRWKGRLDFGKDYRRRLSTS